MDATISVVFEDGFISVDVVMVSFVGFCCFCFVMHYPVDSVSLRVFSVCLWQLGAWLRIASGLLVFLSTQ